MTELLAHGVGTRADLPLSLTFVVVGAAIALVASFVALGTLWRTPRLPLPGRPARVLDPLGRLQPVLAVVVLALSAFVLVVAWFGPPSVAKNLAPWLLYVTFWVGLVPLSLLLGPVWAAVNPLRTASLPLARWARRPDLAVRAGWYPAAVSLLAFAWLELASPNRSDPRHVALFLTAYAVAHLLAAALTGPEWFRHGEGFSAYARLLGSLAPIGRDDGRFVWKVPLTGAAGLPAVRGLWAVTVVLVGSTAFDGLTRTTAWQSSRFGGEANTSGATLGLAAMIVLVGLLYSAGALLAGRAAGVVGALDAYAHSLVPIAAGYAIAHYFSLLLLDGQTTFILASDPFASGANLFGTAGAGVNYLLVSARTISLVQVAAIVLGHVGGLVLAHDQALELDQRGTRPHRPWVAQLPLLTFMVVLTCGALLFLLGS